MTPKYHKTLSDRFLGGKVSVFRAFLFVFIFTAITIMSFGAAPFAMAMALIMHPDGTNISGRSQGTVFQRNGIRRSFAMPSNPGTPSQTAARNRLSAYSSLWRSLTESERTSWLNLLLNRVNRLGKSYTIKGKSVYVYLNAALDLIGIAPNDSAPELLGIVSPEYSTKPVIDVSDAEIDLNLSNADASMGLVVSATLPIPAGRYRGTRAIINAMSDSSTLSPTALFTAYQAHYGYTIQANDRIELSCYYINNTTGETSPVSNFGIIKVQA